ncbi:MAG TPA: M15 family metallopeptidase [Baekduia sp.]|nr:M15 family metallopeptidase [Baekduia sp.]
MASREIKDLSPAAQVLYNKFADRCRRDVWMLKNGITVMLTCTYRSPEEQARLYAQGRTAPGKVVTNAKPGKSRHNAETPQGDPAAEAFDVVPLRFGKPVWGTAGDGVDENPDDDHKDDMEVWQRVGAHGKAVGLEWAGDWKSFREFPHFQLPE